MKPTERLYLQYKPDEQALQYLLDIQKIVKRANPQARTTNPDRMHLTLIHFGILTEVYEEIRMQQPKLTWGQYEASVIRFIDESQRQLPDTAVVTPLEVSMYGSRNSVLALKVNPGQRLMDAHAHCLAVLKEFLLECGIEYPMAFMQGSRNFSHAAEFNPHITLLRAARKRAGLSVEKPELTFSRLPVRYR